MNENDRTPMGDAGMEDFERRLRALPLARPSKNLQRRIFHQHAGWDLSEWMLRRKMSFAWVVILSFGLGMAGFLAGCRWSKSDAKPVPGDALVKVKIVEVSSTSSHAFDFTASSGQEFLSGKTSVRVKTNGEVEL